MYNSYVCVSLKSITHVNVKTGKLIKLVRTLESQTSSLVLSMLILHKQEIQSLTTTNSSIHTMYIYIYIHIHIERERERDTHTHNTCACSPGTRGVARPGGADPEGGPPALPGRYIYIYIYICIERERFVVCIHIHSKMGMYIYIYI